MLQGVIRLRHLSFAVCCVGKYRYSRSQFTPPSLQMKGSMCSSRESVLRVDEAAGHMIELMHIHAESPNLHILFIPGNPGIIAFYKDYIEDLYHYFKHKASVTAISHTGHTVKDWNCGKLYSLEEQIDHKDWNCGKLYSLEEQIDHKVKLIEKHFSNLEVPLILVGHSIGAYIALRIFKMLPDKVHSVVGLYPFLTINRSSSYQAFIRWSASIWVLREILSRFAGFMSWLPKWSLELLVKLFIGRNWSPTSIDVAINYLLQYFIVQNFSYMGMTEFQKLKEDVDYPFIRERQSNISLLFGIDDHWGPLDLFEQISIQAPEVHIAIEKEGHSHAFCCTKSGSEWVAGYTFNTISSHL